MAEQEIITYRNTQTGDLFETTMRLTDGKVFVRGVSECGKLRTRWGEDFLSGLGLPDHYECLGVPRANVRLPKEDANDKGDR